MVLLAAPWAQAEGGGPHRRIWTAGVRQVLDVHPEFVAPLLRHLLEAGSYPEEHADASARSCDAVDWNCRDYFPTRRTLYEGLESGTTGSLVNAPDADPLAELRDVLEIIGNESWLTDFYNDWMLDPRLWGGLGDLECTVASYGCGSDCYAGYGHFCPFGCSGAVGALHGFSCQYATTWDGHPNSDLWRTPDPLAFSASAWDSKSAATYGGLFDVPQNSLDAYMCFGMDLAETDYKLGESPGYYAYLDPGEADAWAMNPGGVDIGWGDGKQNFSPLHVLGRFAIRQYLSDGGMPIKALGPAAHALADGAQPQHLAGTMGNFHSWWEGYLWVPFREDTIGSGSPDDLWGHGPTCRDRFGATSGPDCAITWARALIREIDAAVGSGAPLETRYLELLRRVSQAVRDRDELAQLRANLETLLIAAYPISYCSDNHPAGATPPVARRHSDPCVDDNYTCAS
jgi:hypothetical protein